MSLTDLANSASSSIKIKVLEVLRTIKESSGVFDCLVDCTVDEAIIKLTILKSSSNYLCFYPSITMIETMLKPLLELENYNPAVAGPYDINEDSSIRFVSQSDINEKHLFTGVSDLLHISYLSVSQGFNWTNEGIVGTIYGPYSWPMVSLPVCIGDRQAYNVHFLVDTTASRSEIPLYVYKKLMGLSTLTYRIPSALNCMIANETIQLALCSSTGDHVEIPMLGQDFLKMIKASLVMDYEDLTTRLIKK